MLHDLELIAEFSLDFWLLARCTHVTGMSPVDGRAWERAIGDLLRRSPLPNRQRAGLTTLFGVAAASGVAHELDVPHGRRRPRAARLTRLLPRPVIARAVAALRPR